MCRRMSTFRCHISGEVIGVEVMTSQSRSKFSVGAGGGEIADFEKKDKFIECESTVGILYYVQRGFITLA